MFSRAPCANFKMFSLVIISFLMIQNSLIVILKCDLTLYKRKTQAFFFSCHSQGADICRLWRIHQALYCFDYDLEESREIKDMLLECFINVHYIRKEEVNGFFFLVCL